MKKITALALVAISITTGLHAQKKTIEPSGNIITRTVNVKAFDHLKAEGIYELILTQGSSESVKIEADDNMQDYFNVNNDGNTLVIDMDKMDDQDISINDNHKKDKSIHWKVYVTFKTLKGLDVSVVGNIRGESAMKSDVLDISNKAVGNLNLKLSTEKLTVKNEGVGKITLTGNATNAVIKNSGVGELDGDDLLVQTMNIDNSGIGHASVNVQKDLTVQQSFLGKVNNKGAAKKHVMDGVEM